MSKRSFLAAALSVAAAGCALTAAPAADGMSIQRSDRAMPEQFGSVTLCVINPNPDTLVFRRVTVTLDRAGMPLATGSSSATIIVPALSSTRLPLAVLATGQDGPGQRGRSLRSLGIGYRVDGSVALDRAFGLNIPYRHSGRLDAAAAAAMDAMPVGCAGSDVAVPL